MIKLMVAWNFRLLVRLIPSLLVSFLWIQYTGTFFETSFFSSVLGIFGAGILLGMTVTGLSATWINATRRQIFISSIFSSLILLVMMLLVVQGVVTISSLIENGADLDLPTTWLRLGFELLLFLSGGHALIFGGIRFLKKKIIVAQIFSIITLGILAVVNWYVSQSLVADLHFAIASLVGSTIFIGIAYKFSRKIELATSYGLE